MIALLLLFSCSLASITSLKLQSTSSDGSTQDYSISDTFDANVFDGYMFTVPLDTTGVGLSAGVTNDRIWLQAFEETGDDFWDDCSTYDYSSPVFPVSEGEWIFRIKEETGGSPFYTILVNVTFIATAEPSVSPSTSIPTDSPVTSDPSPIPTSAPSDAPVPAITTTAIPSVSPSTGPPQASTTNEAASTTNVALPEQKPDVPACETDLVSEIWVTLVSQEGSDTNHCPDLTIKANANEVLSFDDMCPCFLAADQTYLSTHHCRVNEATMYTFADVANYCYGEEQILEGPTDTIVTFDKVLDTFDTTTWSGTDDEFVYPGQKLRQTFTGNDLDQPDEDSDYILVEFDATSFGDWEVGDKLIVEFDYTTVFEMPIEGSFGTDGEQSSYSFVVPLDPYTTTVGDAHTFTLGFTSSLAGTDEYFSVEPTRLETFTREDLSVHCRPRHSANASVQHPVFEQTNSGFIWNYVGATQDSIRLHLEASVPRHLYDFSINFDGGDGMAGYDIDREFVNLVSSLDETFWTSDLLTQKGDVVASTQDNCGSEIWEADIPWDMFNQGGAGGVTLMNSYNDGSATDSATDYYLFGSTARFEGMEPVYVSEGGREWQTTRESIWRVPFVLRFQRIVYVDTTLEVILCPDEETNKALCTLTAVAAIVEHVQANTVYEITTQDYRADVNLKISTKVMYPYMFITGTKDDDPPNYWETFNQIDPYYQPPLDNGQWSPPHISYQPADFNPGTEVEVSMSFLEETEADCTFNNDNDISNNLGRECPQSWNMYIKPLNGACFIDGTYTVTWAARCFYDKPVCWFNDDQDGNRLNTVSVVFTVHSTNMCPELVHNVDVYGVLCPTGRYDWYKCAEAEEKNTEDIYTYFQNDQVYFFLETESESARIIYSRLLEIWVEQDFTGYDGSVTPMDMNWNGLKKVWDVTDANNNELSFTSSVTGVTEAVPGIMTQTQDSNWFSENYQFDDPHLQGRGDLELGNYAGFQVRLDSRIFPVPADSFKDVTFRTKVEIWYEGWGDQKPDRRRLTADENEREYELTGKETVWYTTNVNMNKQAPTFLPCFDESLHSFWAYKMALSEAQMKKYDGSLESVLNDEMFGLLQTNDVSLVGFTESETEGHVTAIYSASDNSNWATMKSIFEESNFGKDGLFWWSVDVSDVFCLDAPLGTSVASLSQCAEGKPCDFLGGQLLADYIGPQTSPDTQEEESSARALGLMSIVALLVILF